MSLVEKLICNPDFSYLQPYFYHNPYALRCELGCCEEDYLGSATKRAMDIYRLLFPHGADAIMFSYWIQDFSDSGEAEANCCNGSDFQAILSNRIDFMTEQLKFLSCCQYKYRHVSVKGLKTYDAEDDSQRINRIICYADGNGFDDERLIHRLIYDPANSPDISFVSFRHECIFSIYDHRGCDIVFLTREKMREFYPRLQPYFLAFDLEEMRRRYNG